MVKEPPGGAHRDVDAAASSLEQALVKHLRELTALGMDQLLTERYKKFREHPAGKELFKE